MIGLDITGSLARFLEAILLAEGLRLVHVPGIAVNRAGQGFAGGERKSDPRDARTIAELVRTRDLRPILPDDETVIALRLKVTRRRELSDDQTRRISRCVSCSAPSIPASSAGSTSPARDRSPWSPATSRRPRSAVPAQAPRGASQADASPARRRGAC